MEDEKIITLFEQRSERALAELDTKYGKVCRTTFCTATRMSRSA